MESMRSLDTSLPRATAHQQPSSDLLASFKAAALSVTTLYKVAAADQSRARAAGYQDALEDLLSFMERDRIGFTDGEGSRIRQWTIERIDGHHGARQESEDEDEEVVEDDKQRASSPEDMIRSSWCQESASDTPDQAATEVPPAPLPIRDFVIPKDQSTFSFRSTHPYPSSHQREPSADHEQTPQRTLAAQPMRLELVSKSNRQRPSRGSASRPSHSRLGSIAGSKRRLPIGDFFEFGGLGIDSKDFDRPAGKRSRYS